VPEGKRDALVAAAYAEIAEHGFEGLRTREVANAVGVNIATLHYYFPSKEDLIRSVVGFAVSRFQSILTSEGTAAERLRAHFQGLRRLSRDEPELFATMSELMLRSARDPALAGLMQKMGEYWQSTLRALIREARDEGAIPDAIDPDGMSAVIVATLRGVYLLPVKSGAPEGLEKALRQLERLLDVRASTPVSRARTSSKARS
jgi:AcrR family transcriptional regulator